MNKYYTIGQLAKLAGISTKTLRVYERKGLLLPERNGENDYRIYGEEAVKTLGKIQMMKYLDFSLDQIADFCSCMKMPAEKMFCWNRNVCWKRKENS